MLSALVRQTSYCSGWGLMQRLGAVQGAEIKGQQMLSHRWDIYLNSPTQAQEKM